MIPDDRLEALLRRADELTTADPAFLDNLARRLVDERRHRRSRRFMAPRRLTPVARMALAASLVAAIGVIGVLAVIGVPGSHPAVGTVPASPTASGTESSGRPSQPTGSPNASPAATPSGSATSSGEPASTACNLTFDAQPAPGGQTTVHATGFAPGASLTLIYATANGETRTLVGGLDGLARAGDDGSAELGVFAWTKPLARRDRGRYVWRVTDGTCEARIAAVVGRGTGSP